MFPNTTDRRGDLPPELQPAQFMTGTFLDDPADAIDRLDVPAVGRSAARARWPRRGRSGAATGLRARLGRRRPGATGPAADGRPVRAAGAGARAARRQPSRARHRAERGVARRASPLAWARRAVGRGERVLVTCYNDPLGDVLVERLPTDERLTVGPFYTVARTLDGHAATGGSRRRRRGVVGHGRRRSPAQPLAVDHRRASTSSSSTRPRTSARRGWPSSNS